jgi:hypothetical protein
MLLNGPERRPLALPFGPPRRKLVVELRPVFMTIFLIITVERRDLRPPPAMIMVVAIMACATADVTPALVSVFIACVGLTAAFGIVITEPRPYFVPGAGDEAAIVMVIALRLTTIAAAIRSTRALAIVVVRVAIAADILERAAIRCIGAVIFAIRIPTRRLGIIAAPRAIAVLLAVPALRTVIATITILAPAIPVAIFSCRCVIARA